MMRFSGAWFGQRIWNPDMIRYPDNFSLGIRSSA